MPRFDVTTPDGRTIEVTAPEGATEAQAIAYAKTYDRNITTQSGASTRAGVHPQLQDALSALKNADAAGDVAAARELTALVQQLRGTPETPQKIGIDMSKLATADLKALAAGNMTGVSDAGLQILAGSVSQPKQADSPVIGKTVAVTQAETAPAQLVSINRGEADIHAILAVTAGLAAAVLLHWIITRHLWKKPRTTPHNTGLWWGSQLASIALASVVTKLATKTIINGISPDAWYDFGFMGTLTVPPYFLIGYAAGWIFRRLKPLDVQATGASPIAPSSSPAVVNGGIVFPLTADKEHIYATIANELENGAPDKGLWTRLFAESGGDANQTKVLYIKERAQRLSAVERVQMP